jgi:glucose/arabinose dehydrogenase
MEKTSQSKKGVPAKPFLPRHVKRLTLSILPLLFLGGAHTAAQDVPEVKLQEVITTGLEEPLQVVHAGDGSGKLFIVQQKGSVKVFDRVTDDQFVDRGVFFEIAGIQNTGEEGLLSIAFHPNYATNRTFFVFYTNADGWLEIARYLASNDPNRYEPGSGRILLTIPHPSYSNHNGGEMHFGPDGYLYVSTGDGGSGGDPWNRSQNDEDALGKILRLDVDGEELIPADNPKQGFPTFALGLRNPFRWSFDRETGDVWIGDVGQGSWEEINFLPFDQLAMANFGWRCYEGAVPYNTEGCEEADRYVFPIHTYAIGTTNGRSVIGGVVYRGNAFPSLRGYYIGTDYFGQKLHLIRKEGEQFFVNTEKQGVANISDFGESENGEVYAVNRGNGTLYRIIVESAMPVSFVNFYVTETEDRKASIKWQAVESGAFDRYEIEKSHDARNFERIGEVRGMGNEGATSEYAFRDDAVVPGQRYYYRIRAVDRDESNILSSIFAFTIHVLGTHTKENTSRYVIPNLISNGQLVLHIEKPVSHLKLMNVSGQSIRNFDLSHATGYVTLDCGFMPPGLYVAVITSEGQVTTEKVIFR